MTAPPLRVYVNERPLTVPAGSTVAAALAAFDTTLTDAPGTTVTDGRGIAVSLDAPLSGGAILRVVRSGRGGASGGDAPA